MKAGRNDPCPCGSGKKYKRCCLARDEATSESAVDATWRRVRRATDGFPRRMSRFVAEIYGAEGIDAAWAEFMLWKETQFDPNSDLPPLFMPWMFHSWSPEPEEEGAAIDPALFGRQPTSVYLERRGATLDGLHRRYLEACLEAPFSFHEILSCDRGYKFLSRDVVTGEEHEVLERSASRTLDVGDILYGQLVPIDGIVMLEACSPYVLGPADKIPLIDLREKIAAGAARDLPPRELIRDWDFELREIYLDAIERFMDPTPPVLHNTDDELVVPQRLRFEIESAESAFAALEHLAVGQTEDELLADAERDADGRLTRVAFAWIRPGNSMHASWDNTILGHVEISSRHLTADVNSMERAERFRGIVDEALGGSARFLGSELPASGGGEAADGDESTDTDTRDLNALPEVREHLDRVIAAHYEDWPTQEIPSLGHRRPVDMVESPAGREQVGALIEQMERSAKRQQPPQDPAIFARLRERLGLSR
jgi:hypothetical protein